MQRGSDEWMVGPNQCRTVPDSSRPLAEILSVPLSPSSALYSSTHFVRCSADGKDAGLVSVGLDTCGHFLRVKSKEGESAVDIRKLRVRFLYPNELHPTLGINAVLLPDVQLVVEENKPKDFSKIKKLLGSEQVSTNGS